ncbi:DUF4190 domain-containing protein [Streptomyces sp. PU10]|jgi:hypothetical protein|uniref:DUF4190 domain-containing protein n=1 Tax=Streptomyces TaxID=1883 RepID=UPI00106E7A90|nr:MULTISPECIES: DUF4190 domain-containing protein [Streptomyces]MBH5133207.1 DUF4190 domain-containing protein [Streptomyces sp. HB-N217]MDU0256597.1 DUF4190 domain-containing protein [Streptomyces sp. PU10]WSU00957.1 DUF4190 domain-containing protein [Streptomyces sp. NBC_01124]
MTDAIRPDGDPAGGHDPWAPPESGPSLDKGAGAGPAQEPPAPPASDTPPPWQPPPGVHDQATVTSMPGAGYAAPDSAVPPPPVAPDGAGAPVGYGYPGYGQGYGWPGMPMAPQNGMGTASMVLGILACALFCMYGVVSLVLGVLAIVFGVKGRRKAEVGLANNHGQAQAGFVMGIIGVVLGIAVIVLIAVGITAAINDDSYYDDPYYGSSRPAPVSVTAES